MVDKWWRTKPLTHRRARFFLSIADEDHAYQILWGFDAARCPCGHTTTTLPAADCAAAQRGRKAPGLVCITGAIKVSCNVMQLVLFGAVNRRRAFFRHSQFAHSTPVLDRARGACHNGARIGRAQVISVHLDHRVAPPGTAPAIAHTDARHTSVGKGRPPASAALFSAQKWDSVVCPVDIPFRLGQGNRAASCTAS